MFTKDYLDFLRDLDQNNTKEWFVENKSRYEQSVLEPSLEMITAMAPHLHKVSKHMVANARKSGGSLSRIHRDVRFSKDKRPYNTHITMIFHHDAGKKIVAPGYFLKISATAIQLGAGIWQPDTSNTNLIRERIVAESKEWTSAINSKPFKTHWQGLDGNSLKRPPRGFDAQHPLVEDLMRKDFVSFCDLKPSGLTCKDFPKKIAERYRSAARLVDFVCKALDLPF